MRNLILHIILSLAICVAVCTSCTDDEAFTTSPQAILQFNNDTVSFDTVFCDVPSPTKRLIVYNRNTKSIRLTNVSLQSGGSQGFRMNVNGQFGASLNNVEIPAHDSIFIFIETTVETNDSTFIDKTDNIVITLESGIQHSVLLKACGMKAKPLHHVIITDSTSFTNDLPYIIYDSLVVAEGAHLTLPANTTLFFHKGANLIVRGKLDIQGEMNNEVLLRCDRLDQLLPQLPYDLTDSQWGGVMLMPSCSGCNIRYANIRGGTYGIMCDSIAGPLAIHNSTIHNVAGDALHIRHTQAIITNTQLSNALGHCANLVEAHVDFYHCTLAQFYPWSSNCGCALMMRRNGDTNALWSETKMNFYNCLITGYSDDEVYADFNADACELGAHFFNCLLLTDINDDKYFSNCVVDSADSKVGKGANFRMIMGKGGYDYDFHLDSLSIARGKGLAEYTQKYPFDRDGQKYSEPIDVGCFQYMDKLR